ncbi:C25 family cysteine peptidase [Ferruginibacter lapsinanis]|uniref:putative type IX secretion system sortase PorU2 n=1 Tax=Ferruginibacter lapsinanis TaxID=563172 RepID=UPI001E3C6AFA|nr:C25 family cysteine peptidase [Ferruginibacter lapsinanis]UEG49891.1 C25 family cysteine peptidase [Ferruginibacter lapsinanis]
MKKILIPFFLLITLAGHAQLNNSWIDYNKTYYKFTVGSTGLYRINQSVLAAANLNTVSAENFQLWRNGQEVRLYTSVSTGVFGPSDYIEFLGKANDGLSDKQLYRKPEFQLCDSISLITDTAAYFLTVNTASANLRYINTPNVTAGNSLQAETYFMRRLSHPFKEQINRGFAEIVGEYVYSSSYDNGEGWSSYDVQPGTDLNYQFNNLNVYTAGPADGLSVYISASGNALNYRSVKMKLFDNVVVNEVMDVFNSLKKQVDGLPLSYLQNPNSATFSINGTSGNVNDRIVISEIALTYPATFNFNNQKNFYFELKASVPGNYLEIDNFNNGGVAPILYDINNGKRLVGDITSTPGKVKFVLQGSVDAVRKFMLVSEDASNISAVTRLTSRTFINYANTINQGDYLLIANPVLFNDGTGINNVDKYSQYRASVTGGGFNTKIISTDELTDQFAFGIKKHPASIRDFIRFSVAQFSVKPKYIFLIGRGVSYDEYRKHESSPEADRLNLVPTFGWPASDMLLACEPAKFVPLVPIGRIAVVNGTELGHYLDKMKEYEQVQAAPSCSIIDKAWMKNFIHVVGGADSAEDALFKSYMKTYEDIASDTLFGAKVETFKKESTASVEQANGERIKTLLKEGTSLISYFGHSSANTLAFNLSNPEVYENKGKYPFFCVSGCSAGNFFTYDLGRLADNLSLSEKYVLAKDRGSIGFLADSHLGIPPYLDLYNKQFYGAFCRTLYGNSVGNQLKQVLQNLGGNIRESDYYLRMHLEEITLHGDPALKMNHFDNPDFVVEDQTVKISPSIISVADNNFTINVKMFNIGKAVNDSIRVTVKHKLPSGDVQTLYDKKIASIDYIDSVNLIVPINSLTDKGLNQITVTVDADNKIAELCEVNNVVTKDFYIFEDELRPVYPYNYAIVSQQNITYSASTANPLMGQRQFLMEIDTTELFNSAFLKQYTSTGLGGLIQFTPNNVTFTNGTVYYWRTAIAPLTATPPIWNTSSFVYLAGSSTGFNQSHYYQHLHSTYTDMSLGTDRKFTFDKTKNDLLIRTGLYPYFDYDGIDINLNFSRLDLYGCRYNVLQIAVFDSITHLPWKNYPVNGGTEGRFGSWLPCQDIAHPEYRNFFEFPYDIASYRKKAMDFLDAIPSGMYVSITNLGSDVDAFGFVFKNTTFIDDWKADQSTLGTGQSLYHKLKSVGFSRIDEFTKNLPFLFFYKKGEAATYPPHQFVGVTAEEHIEQAFPLLGSERSGTIESPLYGPAKTWHELHWRGTTTDPVIADSVSVEVYGVKKDGTKVLMATVRPAIDTTLAFIDASVYPYVQLKMLNTDEIYATPQQLTYWRINADYLPEGAVAPNILLNMKDTLEQGEKVDFSLVFKNISAVAFDSLKVKFVITDKDNVPHVIDIPKKKALVAGDTVIVRYSIDTRDLGGNNTLYVMFNPDDDQPEQYLFNNFIYKNFYVNEDRYNPLLDITFDGVHILNKDIVAAQPNILVKLKDESRFLALKDTALLKVQVQFPDGSLHDYHFADMLRFTPADLSNGQNSATIEFNPTFTDDGEYLFIVSGKDVVGNKAGYIEYRVVFTVINKPMISNLLNYPNPFTTSTAFVFYITGSEPPQGMRIQILTITGKVVREISKEELGPIHIGRNITEFKWDGTDSYGQKLANGVYLYRVLTSLNGKALDKYKPEGDKTDKFFNKGYGKMYLMR